jgi:hypothetical protein
LIFVARPEGFEPPTPRSVVRFDPEPAKPVEGKSLNYGLLPSSFSAQSLPFHLNVETRVETISWRNSASAFAFDENGRLPYDTVIYSTTKKSGKTTLNAALTLCWAVT